MLTLIEAGALTCDFNGEADALISPGHDLGIGGHGRHRHAAPAVPAPPFPWPRLLMSLRHGEGDDTAISGIARIVAASKS